MANFKIFKQKWKHEKMQQWTMPIKHIGANCGELAISYLGLVDDSTCIKDSNVNLQRGNYGRLTDEIARFLTENSRKYTIDFNETYNLTAGEFLDNNSDLVKLIGNNKETMVLLKSHKYPIGHYVILAVINDRKINKEDDPHLYILDTSFGLFYAGYQAIAYLREHNFYEPDKGININFLKITGRKQRVTFESSYNTNSNSNASRTPYSRSVLVTNSSRKNFPKNFKRSRKHVKVYTTKSTSSRSKSAGKFKIRSAKSMTSVQKKLKKQAKSAKIDHNSK